MNNYFKQFNSLSTLVIFLTLAWGCDPPHSGEFKEAWPQYCKFFTPFTVEYELNFIVEDRDGVKIPDALVTCKVISIPKLPHPFIQDSCYSSEFLLTTLSGVTNANGNTYFNFDMTFGAEGDYFLLEISVEKDGYYPILITEDMSYFGCESILEGCIRCYENVTDKKRIWYEILVVNAINVNP